MESSRYKKRTVKKVYQAAPPESSEPVNTRISSRKQKSRTGKDVPSEEHRANVPRPQVARHALDNITSVKEINEVDAKLRGELTPQEIRDLRFVFDTFDNEHHGSIDFDDLRRAMRVIGFKINQDDLNEISGGIHGGPGTPSNIAFQQFLELVVYKQGDARDIYGDLEQARSPAVKATALTQHLLKGFSMMDLGEKGHLNFDDIKKASVTAGLRFRDSEIRDMMDEADTNGDDLITKDEFFQIMLQTNLF